VSSTRQDLLTLRGHLCSTQVFGGVRVALFFLNSFLCCSIMCRYVLSSCCDVQYDFRIKTMFGSSLPPVVCRRAHVLFTLFVFVCLEWCPIHFVLCFCFVCFRLVCCVSYVASFSGLSLFDCHLVFSNVDLLYKKNNSKWQY